MDNSNSKLDEPVVAVCECEGEVKRLTFRKLKNKWPHCSCNQPMKVKADDAIPPIHTTD